MMDEGYNNRVPIIGVARHRLAVDGQGVTTLVAFHGCTLRCRYCLNAQCLRPDGFSRTITPVELLDEVAQAIVDIVLRGEFQQGLAHLPAKIDHLPA